MLWHTLLTAPGAGEIGVGGNSRLCPRLFPGATAPESGRRAALCRFFAGVDVSAHHPAQSRLVLPQNVHGGLVGSASTGLLSILGTRVLDLQKRLCREARMLLQLLWRLLGMQCPQSRLQGQQCDCLAVSVPWL